MIEIAYFTDVLCIWAYAHEVRMRRLQTQFGDRITLRYHFLPVFAAAHAKLEAGWQTRGGWEAYARHVQEVAGRFEDLPVSPATWAQTRPQSSAPAHAFIKAVELLQRQRLIDAGPQAEHGGRSLLEAAIWELRQAFFRDARNISLRSEQQTLAEALLLPWDRIAALLDSGEALAALFQDFELQQSFQVRGSPTLVFNEGRQLLYGNVGYRVIEANLTELLSRPETAASWC